MKSVLTAKRIRKTRGEFTREEFGRLLKVTPAAIYYWESGTKRPGGPARMVLGMLAGRDRTWVLQWLRKYGPRF